MPTMKTLVLMRHGPADPPLPLDAPFSPEERRVKDHARDLVEDGRRAAQATAAQLTVMPDAIVASDAARARQTAVIVAETIGFRGFIQFEQQAYLTSKEALLDLIAAFPNRAETVLLVGHHEEISRLSRMLLGEPEDGFELLPAHAVLLRVPTDDWKAVGPGTAQHLGTIAPDL
jgi:phosphohistidine phosphatase